MPEDDQETVASLRAAKEYTKERRRRKAAVMHRKLTVRGSYRLAWKRNVGHASQGLNVLIGSIAAGRSCVVVVSLTTQTGQPSMCS